MITRILPAFGLVALIAPAFAATPAVGDAAPDFEGGNWVAGETPRVTSVQALKGEVVVVEQWGVKCPPCRALIKHVQKLHDDHGGKGLHIFAFEAQGHSADDIKACLSKEGHKSYPVSAGGSNNYDSGRGTIPQAWVIGVDGKVVFEGNPTQPAFDAAISSELAKVRFPGLGRNDFDKGVSKALGLYAKKDLGGARREAKKLAEAEKSGETLKADAAWLVEKFTKIGAEQLALADSYAAEKNYAAAQELLGWLATTFKKEEEGTAAQAKLDEIEKDPAAKKELEAMKRLKKLQAQLEGQKPDVRKAALEKFANDAKNAGTRAAAEATK